MTSPGALAPPGTGGTTSRIASGRRLPAAGIDAGVVVVLSIVTGLAGARLLGTAIASAANGAGPDPALGPALQSFIGLVGGFLISMAILGILHPVLASFTGAPPGKPRPPDQGRAWLPGTGLAQRNHVSTHKRGPTARDGGPVVRRELRGPL